jgi:hypothetical protein
VQNGKLVTLRWALQIAAEVLANIYPDYKYAFTTIHVHGALYRGDSLTWEEKVSSVSRKSLNC